MHQAAKERYGYSACRGTQPASRKKQVAKMDDMKKKTMKASFKTMKAGVKQNHVVAPTQQKRRGAGTLFQLSYLAIYAC